MTIFTEEFFEAIGNLFYAIADADKVIEKNEIERIKSIIYSDWFLENHNNLDTKFDNASKIYYHFQQANLKKLNSEEAYNVFNQLYQNNLMLFSNNIKHDIWEAANQIAGTFAGKNKAELIWLTKLSLTFKH